MRLKVKRIFATLLLTTLVVVGCNNGELYPKEEWNKVEPEKHGYSSQKLSEVKRFIVDSMQTTGMMVIVGGENIFQYGNIEQVSYLASCRKSILAMMYGKYVESGVINLDSTLEELEIDDLQGLLPIEKRATIRHLLQARSGIFHPASNGGDDTEDAPERGSQEPGSYYLYNNWDFNTAGAIFEQLTGIGIYQAFQHDIGSKIGLQDFDLKSQKKSGDLTISKYPAYHFYLSTRDMARIGYLALRQGKWGKREVISKEWIEEMVALHTPAAEMNPDFRKERESGYGYMWWLWDPSVAAEDFHGAYNAIGYMGQYITVIPKHDMVIAHKTDAIYGRVTKGAHFNKITKMILESKL